MKMERINLVDAFSQGVVVHLPQGSSVHQLCQFVALPESDFYLVNNGRIAKKDDCICCDQIYRVVPRLAGGKGGFGSMLRALGAQIEKTTNREACRDLSGRRMRDVNNEKKLKDWMDKKAERDREKEKRREERREKRLQYLQGPNHKFEDPEYQKQKMQVSEHLEEALQQGLQKNQCAPSTSGTSTSRKRKTQDPDAATSAKKTCEWLGIDDLSDIDTSASSSSDSEDSAVPGPSSVASAALPEVVNTAQQEANESDSGVESSTKSKTNENSPMDVDSTESDDNVHGEDQPKTQHQEEIMQCSNKPDLLASLPPPVNTPTDPADMDLMTFDCVSALEELGLETLKLALMSRGMKCGGTLQQRAERLWAARGKQQHEIDPSLLAGKSKGKGKGKKN